LLFDHCLLEAAQLTAADQKILYVFDQQKLYESRAIEQFGESARIADEDITSKFGGVLYQERHDVPGLQAADLYTHCWNRYLTDKRRGRDIRTEALEILTLKHQGMKQYTAKHMRMMLSKVPPKVLSSMRKAVDPGKNEKGSDG
jgi:hypothetical protein